MFTLYRAILVLCCILVSSPIVYAQSTKESTSKEKSESEPKSAKIQTKHTITINGKPLKYTATAGTLVLKNDEGKARAKVFYIAYSKDGTDHAKRPITFAFNGGPGSSSVWLHLGVFGPKRVLMKEDGSPTPPPYKMVPNQYTILTESDVVLIDPVTTGYSRPAKGRKGKEFHGVQQDIESVAEFIRLYLSRNKRWQSPKFLAGESYGTTRAAGLSEYLQRRHGINLNGIVLVSAVLNFQTIRFNEGNDLPYSLFLPGYTATAWYHKKLPSKLKGTLKDVLQRAEKFAEGEYILALMKGNRLSKQEKDTVAQKIADFTGLSKQYVLLSNLRVPPQRFFRELLRERRRTVGRFDSRFQGKDGDAAGERPESDPSYHVVYGPYTAALNHYIRSELKYESDLVYEILTGKVRPWDYGSAKNRYLNVAPSLRKAMTGNPYMKVFVANGYYDLATPYFATKYTFSHLGIDSSLKKNIRMGYYEAGHMMYIHRDSFRKLHRDLSKFYRWSLLASSVKRNL